MSPKLDESGRLGAAARTWIRGCNVVGTCALVANTAQQVVGVSDELRALLTQLGAAREGPELPGWLKDGAGKTAEPGRLPGEATNQRAAEWLQAQAPAGQEWWLALAPAPEFGGWLGVLEARIRTQEPNGLDRPSPDPSQEGLLRGAGHELRNGLTGLGFAAETAAMELDHQRPERARHFLKRIQEGVQRVQRQLVDLLLAERLQWGRWKFQPEGIALSSMASRVIARFEAADRARIACHVAGPESAEIDAELVEFMISPLVSNALQFSRAPALVEVHWRLLDRHLEVTVADRGGGVSAGDLPRLFQPYVRLGGGGAGGLGLGLFIARTAAQAHGGTVELGPRPGGGMVAKVVVPEKTSAVP